MKAIHSTIGTKGIAELNGRPVRCEVVGKEDDRIVVRTLECSGATPAGVEYVMSAIDLTETDSPK